MSGKRRRHEPNSLRPGLARDVTGRLLNGPRELREEWLRADGREAVPFALAAGRDVGDGDAAPLEPAMAERVVSAALGLGADHLLACRTQPEFEDELVTVVPQHPRAVAQQAGRFGSADFVAVPPGFAAALLVTAVGFGVVAGPPSFVEAALGADVDEGRRRFAEYAWHGRDEAPHLPGVAYAFGCAMSGPQHAPAWRAWSQPAQVPPGSGVGEQLGLMRRLAAGGVPAEAFVPAWLAARDREIEAGEHATGGLARALRDVLYAVDDFVPDAALRGPEDLDDAGLVDAVRSALSVLSAPDHRPGAP